MPFSRSPKDQDHPFTQVNNCLINDKRLSFQAVGLLSYLLSKPDYWYININDLIRSHSNGESSIRSIIKELISYGYLVKRRLRYPDGRYSSYFYHISESPVKTVTSPHGDFPHVDKPHVDKPQVDFRHMAINKNKIKLKKTTALSSTMVVNTNVVDVSPEFLKKKEECKSLCLSLDVIDPIHLIKKYGLNEVFSAALILKDSTKEVNNPTAFIVVGIKEKWKKHKPPPEKPKLIRQESICLTCGTRFYYMDFKPTKKVCNDCLLKKE